MKRLRLVLISFLLITLMVGCSGKQVPAEAIDLTSHCQQVADGLEELWDAYEYPEHFIKSGYKLQYPLEGDFDPNLYFEVLTHLSLPKGKVLDYVYSMEGLGGVPILYVRGENDPQATESPEFGASFDLIQLDGSPESYLEYAIFQEFSNTFYLFWHANYDYRVLTCGENAMETIDGVINIFTKEYEYTPMERDRMERANKAAWYIEKDGLAEVRFAYFTPFGGLMEQIYQFEKGSTPQVARKTTKVLVRFETDLVY
jgi:hypothetical protein